MQAPCKEYKTTVQSLVSRGIIPDDCKNKRFEIGTCTVMHFIKIYVGYSKAFPIIY